MPRAKRNRTSRTTRVALLLDRSGSMHNRVHATISGANEYVNGLRSSYEGNVFLTLAVFDYEHDYVWRDLHIEDVPHLTKREYRTRGTTALYDAIGRTIRDLEHAKHSSDERTLVVIMTDGLENSSRHYTLSMITHLMHQKRVDGWEFIYLGAGPESWQGGQHLGFAYRDSYSYSHDPHDHRAVIADLSAASASVTRGSTAQAYLAVSPVKQHVEHKVGVTGTASPSFGRAPSQWPVTSKKTGAKIPRVTDQNHKRQRRDSKGRFIKSS